MTRGIFVTGTDTGVGKTLVATALVRTLRARGIDAGAMKPVETGVGSEGPLDALALHAAAGATDPLDDVCPQRFALPAAPTVAAAAEGREVDADAIRSAYRRLARAHAYLVVEGAGGLLVPIWEDAALEKGATMADFAAELGLPVLIVARAALGTINHTLLTREALASRGLGCAGVVISHAGGPLSAADAANLGALRDALGADLVGEVPPLARGAEPRLEAALIEKLTGAAAPTRA